MISSASFQDTFLLGPLSFHELLSGLPFHDTILDLIF